MRALKAIFFAPYATAFSRRALLRELSRREIRSTFTGSMLGIGWLALRPLLSLTVYALVFGAIPALRGSVGGMAFVSQLFAGLIVYQAFSESVSRAARLVVSLPNYVTKVAFPLDLLPWPVLSLAALHAGVSTLLLLLLHTLFVGTPAWTAVLLPLALVPVLLLGLATSWVLASLGVYVRDTADFARVALQLLFFLSPIVWSLELVKNETARTLVLLNPLAVAMETSRALLAGTAGLGTGWLVALFATPVLLAGAGHAFFRRTQDGFADVL